MRARLSRCFVVVVAPVRFGSQVGVGRAEPEWAALNKVTMDVGRDGLFERGEKAEGPVQLSAEIMSGDLSTAPKKVGRSLESR